MLVTRQGLGFQRREPAPSDELGSFGTSLICQAVPELEPVSINRTRVDSIVSVISDPASTQLGMPSYYTVSRPDRIRPQW